MSQRRKILIMEGLDGNWGNRQMAMRTIEALSKIADITVACMPEWFPALPDGTKVAEYNVKFKCRVPQIASLVRSLLHLWKAVKLDKRNHYDYIFFLSYHTVGFYAAKFLIRNFDARIFITHHNNIDDLCRSRIKKYCFQKYVSEANHFVFEPFIKKYLVSEYKVEEKKVFVLLHPQNLYPGEDIVCEYDCVGISGSNDENWIQMIINEEEKSALFKKANKKVLLRSKVHKYDDGFLKVINGYFTDDEYYSYILKGRCVLLPFPDTFCYRMSGSILDALSNRRKVLASDIPLFRDYESRYPHVCKVGIAPEVLIENIKKYTDLEITDSQREEWSKFSRDHSQSEVIKCLKKAFENNSISSHQINVLGGKNHDVL